MSIARIGTEGSQQAGANQNVFNTQANASGNSAFLFFAQDLQSTTYAPGESTPSNVETQSVDLTQEAEVPGAGADNSGSSVTVTREYTQNVERTVTYSDGSREVFTANTEAFLEATGDAETPPETSFDLTQTAPEAQLPAPEAKPEIKADVPTAKPEAKPEIKADVPTAKPEAKPEIKADVPTAKPEAKPEIKADVPTAKPEAKPEIKADVPTAKPEAKPEIKADVPTAKPEAKPEIKADVPTAKPEAKPEIKADVPTAKPEAKPDVTTSIGIPDAPTIVEPLPVVETLGKAPESGTIRFDAPPIRDFAAPEPEAKPEIKADVPTAKPQIIEIDKNIRPLPIIPSVIQTVETGVTQVDTPPIQDFAPMDSKPVFVPAPAAEPKAPAEPAPKPAAPAPYAAPSAPVEVAAPKEDNRIFSFASSSSSTTSSSSSETFTIGKNFTSFEKTTEQISFSGGGSSTTSSSTSGGSSESFTRTTTIPSRY